MAQHFLLSTQARTLSLKTVFKMDEEQAYQTFKEMRWPETDGDPVCPQCGCTKSYSITSRRRFKCVGCYHQFSVTSGTIFASRKLSFVDLLAAIVIFVNGAKGVSAVQVSRDLDVQYKTAFVLSHKLRKAMARETIGATVEGTVEIDGAYFGGYVKPANEKTDRKDRRLLENRSGKRQVVVVARSRDGDALSTVAPIEAQSVPFIRASVKEGATILADEATGWDNLHAAYNVGRVNHSLRYKDRGVCTDQAESFISRLRRMEVGTHHYIAGPYLHAYAGEASWRENKRRTSNGEQAVSVGLSAMASRQSRTWAGYWQKRA